MVVGMTLMALLTNLPAQAKTPRSPRAIPSVDSAVIINSGSQGLPGYRISVARNGRLASVILMRSGRTSSGRKGQISPTVARRFFSDLAQAGPVDALPAQSRSETATPDIAPRVRVIVQYHGRQSPNLRRAGSSAGETLYQDVKQVIQALRLPIPDTP